jgi:hypothetical protein
LQKTKLKIGNNIFGGIKIISYHNKADRVEWGERGQ